MIVSDVRCVWSVVGRIGSGVYKTGLERKGWYGMVTD